MQEQEATLRTLAEDWLPKALCLIAAEETRLGESAGMSELIDLLHGSLRDGGASPIGRKIVWQFIMEVIVPNGYLILKTATDPQTGKVRMLTPPMLNYENPFVQRALEAWPDDASREYKPSTGSIQSQSRFSR